MKQLTQVYKTGEIQLADVPAPALRPGGVLVQTAFSLISAGTERAFLESLRVGGQMPIPFADILHSHLATLGAVHSLTVGAPVAIDSDRFLADAPCPVASGASGS